MFPIIGLVRPTPVGHPRHGIFDSACVLDTFTMPPTCSTSVAAQKVVHRPLRCAWRRVAEPVHECTLHRRGGQLGRRALGLKLLGQYKYKCD